ncbi:LacI family transcriptional regulator [Secundilactobacillus silagincola]|uniref:LacI family transcriptional regulator n=1 Tax=Secundilactobacillus silagincola TaxID=1714681 RepID=A0A1Z5J2I7_9LACO|nr:LacI family DNA-binding transcriptional regulator [Secundilactobacillus silagincola]GAX08227.1 LacI family transcriptional regulator [Secundilactobacillus silagincola]
MPTIREIAKLANVSPGTVSRALNPNKKQAVASETIEKVKKIAAEVGYEPVQHKETSQHVLTCALITTLTLQEETEDEYWHFIRKGIYETAAKESVAIQNIFRIQNGIKPNVVADFDAVIILGSLSSNAIMRFKAYNKNIVIIDDVKSDDSHVDTIGTNLYALTRMALDKLSADTDGPIAFIGGNRLELRSNGSVEQVVDDPRTSAYHDWAAIKRQKELLKLTSWSSQAGLTAVEALLSESQTKIGALLVASDPLAIGVMKGLREQNIMPGKDISIISFDGIKLASFLTPVLTSIWLPKEELGITAINQIKNLVTTNRDWSVRTEIPGRLGTGDTYPIREKTENEL